MAFSKIKGALFPKDNDGEINDVEDDAYEATPKEAFASVILSPSISG